jgi:hypothetical protein
MVIYKEAFNIDVNRIDCSYTELLDALKELDNNLSQISRITLNIDSKTIYIYHESFSGNKSAFTSYTDNYGEATMLACMGARKKKFIELYQTIKRLYKES